MNKLFPIVFVLLFFGCDEDNPTAPEVVQGCTDSTACNYDETATDDDESCAYTQENYDCDGNCLVYIDCNGVCGGTNTSCEDCFGAWSVSCACLVRLTVPNIENKGLLEEAWTHHRSSYASASA